MHYLNLLQLGIWYLLIGVFPTKITDSSSETKSSPTKGWVGMNLSSISYYSSEIVFVDVFKQSQEWKSQAEGKPYGEGGPMELTPTGWVKQLTGRSQFAESLIFHDLEGHYPSGIYVCLYEGKGVIEFSQSAEILRKTPGRITVKVDAKRGSISLRIRKTDPSNPIRNIRLILPGFERSYKTRLYHPDFLKRLQGVKVLRFMDWGMTNNSKVVEWKDRITPAYQTQGSERGVALEYQIMLANELDAIPWFCVPHKASDEYIREFAKLIKAKLKPSLKFYLEYSNETWNGMFEQATYCREQGKELKLSDNDYEAQLRYSSHRSVEIFQLMEKELGGRERMIRVIASQSANSWAGGQEVEWKEAYKSIDAVAIAPYFGNALGDPKTADEVAKLTVEEIIAKCEEKIVENKTKIEEYINLTKKYNLDLIAYEGGQHLTGYAGAENNDLLTKKFLSANRHPKMKELYLQDLHQWQKLGGGLFCVFATMGRYSKWGSWGLLEFYDDSERKSPKYQAIRAYILENQKK